MRTKDILAGELAKIGLLDMSLKAANGYYHDFLSPLATPCLQLASDLAAVGTREAMALRERHLNGEFDIPREVLAACAKLRFTALPEAERNAIIKALREIGAGPVQAPAIGGEQ